MLKDDVATILGLEGRLRARVRSQDGALGIVAEELRAARIGLKPPGAPLGVFLLVGSSGVGKTETALALQEALFGDERFLIQLDMGEFQEAHTVSRLFGSPPGYVGFGEGGKLTEAVRQRPYSVVLLDEIEKAHKDILNAFYGLFDKGRLTDGEGRVIDFSNTVVIMTSNLATDLLTEAAHPTDPRPSLEQLVELARPTLRAHFKPALLARMTVVPYFPLGKDALQDIARSKLALLATQAWEQQGVEVLVGEEVVAAVADRCKEVDSGARNVEHVLKGAVRPRVSNAILEGLAAGAPPTRLRLALGTTGDVVCLNEGT
jgi:type VI secretion system protein VasG